MNIMFIADKMCGGGAERVTATLASVFCQNHKVYLVTHRDDEKYDIDERVIIKCLKIPKGTNLFNRALHLWISVLQLRKLKKKWEINCSISMLSGPNVRNILSRQREKVIISVRNKCSEAISLNSITAKLNTLSCLKADCVVTLSKAVEIDEIEKFHSPKHKTITIYNPCDVLNIKKNSNSLPDDLFMKIRNNSRFVAITAGRLVEQKGQWHLIRAFSDVVKLYPDAALVILGKGELEAYLQDLINKMGLKNNVFLLGFQHNPYKYMERSDVFVFSSLFEGFGNILLEAMACSLPIISCDCPAGPRELLAPDTNITSKTYGIEYAKYGILTELMDGVKYRAEDPLTRQELCLAKAIELMVNDQKTRETYKIASNNRIKDFSISSITKQWEEIMQG